MEEKMNFTNEPPCEAEENTTNGFYPLPYKRENNCIAITRHTKEGLVTVPLCNFVAWVEAEITRDTGTELRRELLIAGEKQNGTPLPSVRVGVDEVAKMEWMRNAWPSDCNLTVINSVERHVQYAIRSTAVRARQEQVFEFTGWKKIDGEWQYLMPGGGTYEVSLCGKQRHYCLEVGASEQDLICATALPELDFAPPEVLQTGLALVFLSPLNEFLRQAGCEPKFILTLVGHTGCRKSSLAAWLLSFYGSFSATDLPMSFRDTANSMTYNGYTLKDVLTCVDDYHPVVRQESVGMKSNMQLLCRGYGDRAARNGLTSTYQLREARPPQGNVIVTAEHIPDVGESGVARLLCVEMGQNSLDLSAFSKMQRLATQGVYRRVLYAYVQWIKNSFLCDEASVSDFVGFLREFCEQRREWYSEALKSANIRFHGRTADAVACLELGFFMLLRFLKDVGALDEQREDEHREAFENVLLTLAAKQSACVAADKPTHIFVRKLMGLLDAGECSLLSKNNPSALPPNFVGYEDEEYYYLVLENAHRLVKRMCDVQDESFSISAKALAKALFEEGFLLQISGKNTGTMRFGNASRRVMRLRKSAVEEVMRCE